MIKKVSHIAIAVPDIEEAAKFYEQLLGLKMSGVESVPSNKVKAGFIPVRDNLEQAQKHGVRFIAQPGGSTRDDDIEAACREYGIAMVHTDLRLFHH